MAQIRAAFYKGKGDFFDHLVRIWTRSEYSHVELVIEDRWYTSSPRDGGVRFRYLEADSSHWDFIDIRGIEASKVEIFLISQLHKKYDWLGIFLTQVFPLGIDDPNRWFCSEIVAAALQHGGLACERHFSWYSPKRLYEDLRSRYGNN